MIVDKVSQASIETGRYLFDQRLLSDGKLAGVIASFISFRDELISLGSYLDEQLELAHEAVRADRGVGANDVLAVRVLGSLGKNARAGRQPQGLGRVGELKGRQDRIGPHGHARHELGWGPIFPEHALPRRHKGGGRRVKG